MFNWLVFSKRNHSKKPSFQTFTISWFLQIFNFEGTKINCCHFLPNVSNFTFLVLCNSRICHLWHGSSQRKELLRLTPHWSILPFSNWNVYMSTQTCWCVFTQLCLYHLELERTRGPLFFCLGYFSLSKKFNHFA